SGIAISTPQANISSKLDSLYSFGYCESGDSKKLKPKSQKKQATLPTMLKSNINTPYKGERQKEIVKG
ncbi:16359_t:CDS:2, partial [Racocetra persica]